MKIIEVAEIDVGGLFDSHNWEIVPLPTALLLSYSETPVAESISSHRYQKIRSGP